MNVLEGSIRNVLHDGTEVTLLTGRGISLEVRFTARTIKVLGLQPGVQVHFLIEASSLPPAFLKEKNQARPIVGCGPANEGTPLSERDSEQRKPETWR